MSKTLQTVKTRLGEAKLGSVSGQFGGIVKNGIKPKRAKKQDNVKVDTLP
jgi:hypothetical protein